MDNVLANLEAEQAVLGSCLIDRDVVGNLLGVIDAKDFRRDGHRVLYQAILDLYLRHIPADLIAVVDHLASRGDLEKAGGESYLAELIAATPTSVHAPYYAKIVAGYAVRRRLEDAGSQIVRKAHETGSDLTSVLADVNQILEEATTGISHEGAKELSDIAADYLARFNDPPPPRVMFGMSELDALVGGMRPGNLVVVGASTSVGKSAFALQVAFHNISVMGTPTLIFSTEMSDQDYFGRMVAREARVAFRRVMDGASAMRPEERERVLNATRQMQTLPMAIIDKGRAPVEALYRRCRDYITNNDIKLLVVDHMADLFAKRRTQNRNDEMTVIVGTLKQLALEMKIPVLVLHQLNRGTTKRGNETTVPMLSDLRDSGSVEQNADIVIFLHRPGQYDSNQSPTDAQIIVAKHRNGPKGRIKVFFNTELTCFEELNHLRAVN